MQAVYRLRAAEDAHEQNVSDLKMGDGFPIPEGWVYRHCLYAGKPLEEYLEYSATSTEARCPRPAWV